MHAHQDSIAIAERRSCPFCQSTEIKTTGKAGQSNPYWRCAECGEIWNPSSTPAAPPRRWSGSR